jgi:hypothetical protein
MTEILGSDDPAERGARRRWQEPAQQPDPAFEPLAPSADGASAPAPGLPVELLGDGWDDEPEATPAGRSRLVLGALGEPGSLAVAAGFCLLASALAGPSYRFDAYPFNQGVGSLANGFSGSLTIHPLHDYLTACAPNIALAAAGVLIAVAALLRGRGGQPGWVRPLAAGALLASVLVLALLGLGAYRTSTYDLSQPTTPGAAGTTG